LNQNSTATKFIFDGKNWTLEEIKLPNISDVLQVMGSGKTDFNKFYKKFQTGPNKNTSRNVFHSFCHTLKESKDNSFGGCPQLVGIIRKPESTAITYGIIHDKKRYYLGAILDKIKRKNNV